MQTHHLRALTGIRFFAALWVVLYHSVRHNSEVFSQGHPQLYHAVAPLAWAGVRGVDLFFMLSGFVLALNYMDRLGSRLEVPATLRFLWLRLARIWPLYLLVILTGGALRIVRHDLWDSASVGPVTWTNLLRQALMVQQWFRPEHGPTSWVGPAWSLSAEWLAYLLFPVIVLGTWRLRNRLRPWQLLALVGVALVPLVVGITVQHAMTAWVWIPRILCEFTAGMLLCAGLSRLEPTARTRRVAGVGAVVTVLAVATLITLSPLVAFWTHTYVVVLFAPLIAFLALGSGPLVRLLGSPALVLGGGVSYALYLVHSPMLHLLRDVTAHVGVFRLDRLHTFYAEIAFVPVMVVTAWLLYRFFEEPVRRLMRRSLGSRPGEVGSNRVPRRVREPSSLTR